MQGVFYDICLFTYSVAQHILSCVFALFVFVLCTLCCQFLWTIHFWLPLRYSLTFICILLNDGICGIISQQITYSIIFQFYNNCFYDWLIWFLVFNATFSNISAISWRPVLVVEEGRVPGENHRPWASNLVNFSLATASRVHPFL